MRDVILSLLAKEPAHGYELRQRLVQALGPVGGALNPGQVYVTLSRLERAGLVEASEVAQPSHPDKKVYELTASGRERVEEWLADVTWSKVAPLEFHLKLVAAAATRLADPVALVDAQRLELLRELRLACRLAVRNLRRRPGQALLLLLTLTIATGVLGMATALLGSADAPWDRVWRATNGFHVSLTVYHPPDEPGDRALVAALRRRATQLTEAPEVTGVGGPWTHLYGSIQIMGGPEDLTAEIRDPGPSQVDQPLVTSGRWLGDGDGVVLESGLAATLDAGPGDTVSFQATDPSSSVVSYLETWRQRRADSHSDLDILAGTLLAAGALIAMLTVATAAVLVAGRMAAQVRQVGTLKAVGVTPRQVVLVLLVEHLAIAAGATALGLGVGRLLAPRVAAASVTVLGTPEPPPLGWARIAVVAAVAVAVVVLGTVRPALRGIRQSTLRSLVAGPRPPRRPGRLARVAANVGVPLPGVLGMRPA